MQRQLFRELRNKWRRGWWNKFDSEFYIILEIFDSLLLFMIDYNNVTYLVVYIIIINNNKFSSAIVSQLVSFLAAQLNEVNMNENLESPELDPVQ